MRQARFELQHGATWEALRGLLERLERGVGDGPVEAAELPGLYRAVCGHYSLALERHYSRGLTEQLHQLVQRGHRLLYARRSGGLRRLADVLVRGFPVTLRRHARWFWLATALFYLPALAAGVWTYHSPDAVYSLLDPASVAELEQAYDPANRVAGRPPGRDAATDFSMFGFYIWNNVAIDFRTFATGIFFGIGTVVILLYNGVVIGGVAGHITAIGHVETFWPFVSGHAPFELTAVAVSGTAGLLLGLALLAPGNLPRRQALVAAAREAAVLIGGAVVLSIGAALIEAFWSSSAAPATVKYAVSAALWVLLALYLVGSGRGRRASR